MTTSVDELLADDWQRRRPYDAEVVCECGEAWMTRCIDGRPQEIDGLRCSACGEKGTLQ